MDIHIFIAIIAVLLNLLLATVIPCLIKDSDQPFINDMKKVFNTNKELILSSSIILGITVYLALKITPLLDSSFTDMTGISFDKNIMKGRFNNNVNFYQPDQTDQLKYLLRLRS